MANKRPSNLPYLLTAIAALAIIVVAWVGRDWFGSKFVQVGVPAPGFEARTLDGEPVSLADYEGKVVLLNIWATWCPPCRVEMPSMQRLYQSLDRDDFEIVAVSVDAEEGVLDPFLGERGGNVRAFADSLSLTFPILRDPRARIMRAYQATMVPESFVIGREGIVWQKMIGQTEWDAPEYEAFFRRLLDGDG
jgi:peroxiredoxin